jgi:hypothetical protein
MIIEIDDKIIKYWYKESKRNGDGEEPLTKETLKEMVEDYLQDYFS